VSTHDIIDNRTERLVDHINRILPSTERAKFAVGYFFLSGLEPIQAYLDGVSEIRLLIGNTTSRETLEQITEGYKRLELVKRAAEQMQFARRVDQRRAAQDTAENVRHATELMDQTDGGERVIRTLVALIEQGRLKVRVYTKGRLHAKAYIFDYKEDGRYEKGIAIVGSSNLTLSGITHNTELNVVVQGNENHAELGRWFDELWNESHEFDETLMHELQQSWALASVRPYDIYMKALYHLVKDRLEGIESREILWDDEITRDLADFQKVAVRQAVDIIRSYRGAFVADVVGLGKSYIGAAIVKHFERTEHARPLIICPAALTEMWERYDEVYNLNARVVSMGMLTENSEEERNFLKQQFAHRTFVLVDESHNFRHPDTQRYRVLRDYLAAADRRCVFLTATPRNKTAWDIYHQIKLFHPTDQTDLPVDPPDLREFFRMVEDGQRSLPELLSHLLRRRTRNHILRWYGFDAETHQKVDPARFREYLDGKRRAYVLVGGRHQFFPKRQLETIGYSIEETYQGLYQRIRQYLGHGASDQPQRVRPGEISFARYGLWNYVKDDRRTRSPYDELHRAGANLRGLIRVLLFKRFESSVEAFRQTLHNLRRVHDRFLAALDEGLVPAGDEAQYLLYEWDEDAEPDLMDALRRVTGRYQVSDFDVERLRRDVKHDRDLLTEMLELVDPITADKDAKLQRLKARLAQIPLSEGKRLIFTQYADTARYLYENLNPAGTRADIEVIYSGDRSKMRVVGRFAPKANPEYRFARGETEIITLIATDVLAEGLNLQDCDKIINYDLHWNPVRLIQRFGRIDRIGSDYDVIYGYNFLPETELERNLHLHERLAQRIREIHETIGEDSAILDSTEQLNESAMYAIYESRGEGLADFEDSEGDVVDLNEAEEMLRQLRTEDPKEFERIAELRDGIRTGKAANRKGVFVFCEAGRYQQLFLAGQDGSVISRDLPRVLSAIQCQQDEPGLPLPTGYNQLAMRVKARFDEEVKQRQLQRDHTLSLTPGQRYVIRELRIAFDRAGDNDNLRGQIVILEQAFRAPASDAVKRELNLLRRNAVTGTALVSGLTRTYHEHNLRRQLDRDQPDPAEEVVPRIICSEALV
jgi:superfamily II DNA or RNA helicase